MIENLTNKTVFLAKDKYHKTFVHQSYSDRLFHTFILGTTGCGKVSQTIIPMIKQDLDNSVNNNCSVLVLDPTSDLEENVNEYTQRNLIPIIRFNPKLPNCPYYNPLAVDEDTCIKNINNMFLTLNPDCIDEYKESILKLITNSIKVTKRLYKDKAILKTLEILLNPYDIKSKNIIEAFSKTNNTNEDNEIASWFIDVYFKEIGEKHEKYETFCHDILLLNSDKYLGRILNPPIMGNTISFEELIYCNMSATISTAYGLLRENGKRLSALIISEIQSAIFKRNKEKNTNPLFLYLHEAQTFFNKDFMPLVTCGKAYNIGCILTLQSFSALDEYMNKSEKETIISNVRNTILYPCVSDDDVKYFKLLFENIVDKLDPNENTISKLEFSENNLKYRAFPEFFCSLILNGRYAIPTICTPIEYK